MPHPLLSPQRILPKLYLGIVDFDSAIYRCAAVHENDEHGLAGAKLTLMSFVQDNIVNPTNCDQYLFVVTGESNFRHDIAISKPYKGQRQYDKPIHYAELFEWAIEKYKCLIAEEMEADDYVVNCHQKYSGDSVLIGMDKDNLQSPGWHLNFVAKENEPHAVRLVTLKDAQYSLAYQMLRGDPGDNIPGIPGIGEAKAYKALDESDLPPMQVVWNMYQEKGLSLDYYKEQYALLAMLKDTIIDFENNFIQLEASSKDGFEEEDGFDGFEENSIGVQL